MSGNGVNYPKVVDQLADTIKELNVPCVAPAAPAERTAEERKRDAADVLRGLLQMLEGGAGAGDAAAGAAAEHGAAAANGGNVNNWRDTRMFATGRATERTAHVKYLKTTLKMSDLATVIHVRPHWINDQIIAAMGANNVDYQTTRGLINTAEYRGIRYTP